VVAKGMLCALVLMQNTLLLAAFGKQKVGGKNEPQKIKLHLNFFFYLWGTHC